MLIVIVEVRVPEGAIESVKDAIATMEAESRKEPGCHTYAFSVDVNDATMVRITELWESRADLEGHFTMPHMAGFSAALGQLDIQSMDVKAYELGDAVPMPV
ncbi:MAG: putative quinol monooxygenase [Marinobacter sp.]|uniref:putative quinol monooxygenase n=1 Tax=Marinobacter sp. TaxID=50741 RepID=UPI0032983BAB